MNKQPLRYFFFSPINSYDTYEADNYANMQVARNIYGTLVSDLIDGVPQGVIAETWDVSSDGKVWKFKIRKNITFEDGSQITPEIVLMNFKRILWLTQKEGLVLNSLLPEVQSWKSMNEESKSIFINEQKELLFKFVHRPVSLLEAISQPIYGIAHPSCFDKDGKWKNVMSTISSGQYRISERSENSIHLISRNMYQSVDSSPQSAVIYWPTTKEDSVINALKSNRADLIVDHGLSLSKSMLSEFKQTGIEFSQEPPLRMHFVELNYKKKAFSSLKDRQEFRDIFLSKFSSNTKLFNTDITVDASFIPKGGVGYQKINIPHQMSIKNKKLSRGSLDVLLYPYFSNPELQKALDESILGTLEIMGFKPNIFRYETRLNAMKRVREGDFDLVARGSGIFVKNPFGDLRMMFMSRVGARIPDSSGKIPNLITQAELEQNPEVRAKIATKINESIFNDASAITFAHSGFVFIHRGNVDLSRYNVFADPLELRAVGWLPHEKK